MQTVKMEKDWKYRILDYIFAREDANRSTPSEDDVNAEELRIKEMKNKIISEIIENSPETQLLKLIYRYSPPPKPTLAVKILCQRIRENIREISEASLEELDEYYLPVSERRAHEPVPALELPDDIIQHPATN